MCDSLHMKYLKPFLIIPGIWPLELKGIKGFLYEILFYASFIFFVLNVGTVYITTKEIFKYGKLDEITESMANTVFATLLCFKAVTYRSAGVKDLLKLITISEEKILERYDEQSKKIYKDNVKNTKFLGSIIIYQGILIAFSSQVLPLLNTLMSKTDEDGYKKKYYIVPNWTPFDKYEYYYAAYFIHFTYTSIAQTYICFCGIFFLFILKNISGQLQVLQHRFSSVHKRAVQISERDGISLENASHIVLLECIDLYQEIIRLFNHIENTFYKYIFIDYVFTSFGLSLVVFEFLLKETVQTKLPVAGFFFAFAAQSLLLYYQADEAAWMSSYGLRQAIFTSNWYQLGISSQKLLIFTLFRAKKPLMLSIGPFRKVGVDSIIALFKATYSYLSLMWK